jgi:Fe-S oxidoreductase
VIEALDADLVEMKKCRTNGLCCGAGGSQMFKEDEPGDARINQVRSQQALEVNPDIIAVACPFCNTMMTDGVKGYDKQDDVKVLDLAELIATANSL